ncbi:hypothetical protein YC2023_016060 [Brassica napus]
MSNIMHRSSSGKMVVSSNILDISRNKKTQWDKTNDKEKEYNHAHHHILPREASSSGDSISSVNILLDVSLTRDVGFSKYPPRFQGWLNGFVGRDDSQDLRQTLNESNHAKNIKSLSSAGSGSDPTQRLAGMKRVAVSSPLASLPPPMLFRVSSSATNIRASLSCSHGPRRNDGTEDLIGDLSFSSSDTSHGFLRWWDRLLLLATEVVC